MYELHHRDAESGGFLYFTLRRPDQEQNYWNHASETWQALTVANWLEYAMLMTELPLAGQLFKGTLPALSAQMVPDWYWAEIYAGGETEGPLITDSRIAGYLGYWNGTRFRYWSPDDEQTLTQLAALLAPLLWQNPTRTVTDVLGKVLGGGSSVITGIGAHANAAPLIASATINGDVPSGRSTVLVPEGSTGTAAAGDLLHFISNGEVVHVGVLVGFSGFGNWTVAFRPSLRVPLYDGDELRVFGIKVMEPPLITEIAGAVREDIAAAAEDLIDLLGTPQGASLSADVEAIAGQVWQNPTRTLTTPAHLPPAGPLKGTALTLIRGNTFSLTLTGLGSIAGRLVFTVKKSPFAQTVDQGAEIQIDSESGLLRLNRNPVNAPGWGSVTVQDAVAGNVLITITAAAMAQLPIFHGGTWDVKEITADNPPIATTRVTGPAEVLPDTTRAIE